MVTIGLVAVLGLVVMRAQSPKPTVTLPKAAGGSSWIEGCRWKYDTADADKCAANPVSEAQISVTTTGGATIIGAYKQNAFSTDHVLGNNESYVVTAGKYPDFYNWPWRAYVCTGKKMCFDGGKVYCSNEGKICGNQKSDPVLINSNEVTIKVPDSGASSAVGFEVYAGSTSNTGGASYTAKSPIGGTVVSSLTPTFSWNYPPGLSYQVICVGSYADGHPPGSCNFVNCTADFGPSVSSYTMTSSLTSNTDYRWLVYGGPGNPAPTTGCQSFKTGAVCSSGQTLCGSSCVNLQTDNNNCGACGAKCSSGQSCSAGVCGTSCSSSVVAPTLVLPADGSTSVTTLPKFVWDFGQDKACTSGLTYRLYSGGSASSVALFEGAVLPGSQCTGPSGAACSFTPTAAASLQNGTKYYWKVQALRGSDSATADSSIQSFTTGGSNQMNACWGNGGADGTCVDCNGDGVINVLDFSCFASLYTKPVM